MSRIDELIKELCPEGVLIRELLDVVVVHKGVQLGDEDFVEGPFPVVTASRRELRSHSDSNFGPGVVTITSHGAYAGHVNFWDSEIWLANNVLLVEPDPSLLGPRFLYFLLSAHQAEVAALARGGGVPYFNARDLSRISVPIPPLPVQEEIVRILDTFTELEAELEGELEARTTQYEEIRNRLMAFDDVEVHPLSGLIRELCPEGLPTQELRTLVIRHSGTSITATKMRQLDSPVGEIRVFAGGNTVATVPVDSIPAGDVIETPSVIVKSRGNIGFDYFDRPFSHKSELWSYSSRDSRLNIRFLFHYLESRKFELHALARSKSVKLPQLSVRDTDGLKIPLPPATIQEDIVRILDAFGSLVGDLSSGLPAEIAARRKQYEHYRDKLLSFEDVAA